MVQHLHHLPPRADRRAGRARGRGRQPPTRPSLDDVAAGGAAPETWLRAAEAYAGFLARKGKKDEALDVLDQADEFSVGRVPIAALREKIEKGKPVAPLVARAGRRRQRGAAQSRHRAQPRRRRGLRRLYLQLALALEPDSDVVLLQLAAVAEQQNDAEEAIDALRADPGGFAAEALAELQLGLNLADLDRHDEAIAQLKKLLDAGSRRHARLSGARRRLCVQGGFPQRPPRSTTRRSARLTMPTSRRLEHLLPARHRL